MIRSVTTLTPAAVADGGLGGLVDVLELARTAIDQAGDLPALRTAQSYVGIALAAARLLQGRTSPLTSDTERQQARALHGEAEKLHRRGQRKLADEIDAAQERGEVAQHGDTDRLSPKLSEGKDGKPASFKDIGIGYKEAHTARQARDFDAANPGAHDATVDAVVAEAKSPHRAVISRRLAALEGPDVASGGGRLTDSPLTPLCLDGFAAEDLASFDAVLNAAREVFAIRLAVVPDADLATSGDAS